MMNTFAGQSLFRSGPTRYHVAGLTLRHADQASPHSDGLHLIAQGREARPITQTGTLLADNPQAMAEQLDAIEDQLDGRAYPLVDDTGRAWDDTVMLRFVPGPITAVGPRCRVDYTVDYLQVKP